MAQVAAANSGNAMTPTAKQRYLTKPAPMTKEMFASLHPTAIEHLNGRVRVLQQWWENNPTINLGFGDIPTGEPIKGEWRDIPVEGEA